ncbi:MAG: hypothetical protein KDE31_28045, partial [Caldilineaceae bacterium]|nr:hypothetical protein [Caldilineaceae bacterium]
MWSLVDAVAPVNGVWRSFGLMSGQLTDGLSVRRFHCPAPGAVERFNLCPAVRDEGGLFEPHEFCVALAGNVGEVATVGVCWRVPSAIGRIVAQRSGLFLVVGLAVCGDGAAIEQVNLSAYQ